jgi:homogentisate 1,2-dioxygenase
MRTLSHTPDRVVFGVGAEAATPDLLADLGARRVLLVAQDRHAAGAERLQRALGERSAGLFLTDRPQVPGEVADAAVARAREAGVDWVLAHGGGTPIGVAKAVALALDVKVAAIPTTYAGSERTDIWGITRDGVKETGRDPRVRPRLVVYDPALTTGLARELSLTSLVNALAHAVEALYAADATDVVRAHARRALPLLLDGLEAIAADPADPDGRAAALEGAWLASEALGAASMGLHHKLAHVLGGSFDAPHAATHAALLPYTLTFNAPFAPDLRTALHVAWGTDDPGAFLYDRMRAFGLSTSLRAIGLTEADLPRIVELSLARRYDNPRPLDADALTALLHAALHDRRPSLRTRHVPLPSAVTGPHAAPPVTVRGAPIDDAKVVVLALHGRGASADRLAADLERRIGPRVGVAFVAPQARDNTWYPKGYLAPVDENQPSFDSALAVVQALYDDLAARVGPDRVVLAGFSQGACLLLTWLSITASRPRRALAFTGAPTPLPHATFAAAAGLRLHLGSSAGDPWIAREPFEAAAARFREAGANVDVTLVPGDVHGIHPPDDAALRRFVDDAAHDGLRYLAGFGAPHATEAVPGALPTEQNSPRPAPFGLFAEQINGTGFTVRRAENRRTWMYRLRPQILPTGFVERPTGRFVGDFSAGVPTPEHLGYRPLPIPEEPTDFLAGLVTFAGAGDAATRRGAAIHLYAANADMGRTALSNADGDLLIVPERGALRVRTELGVLRVDPGEVLIVPQGLRFHVALPDGAARGFVAEVFDGHLTLPERGPIGANGLADERHFLTPVAAFEDDPEPWTIVVRQGGRRFETRSAHGPFDVVAWHGDYAPFKYDLARFNSLGTVSFDHPDPSILTVLTCPLDDHGRNALDLGVFRGRWDVAEHTFRPPFFHRNAAVEFNAVIRSPAGSRWQAGAFTYTPYLTPHGVSAAGYARAVAGADADLDAPVRMSDDSLWIQFESAYALKVMPWMLDHAARDPDHLAGFVDFRPRARLP